MNFPKHLLSIADLDREQISELLDLALDLKRNRKTHAKPLLGQTIGVLTSKPSLRTRISFEVAIIELGGDSLFIKNDEVGLGVREEAGDIAEIFSRYLSGIVVRAHAHQPVVDLANSSKIPVINALTDLEHPCQILADLLTLKERFGELKGLKLGYVGDGNNVTNSLMLAASIVGMEFYAITPASREPIESVIAQASVLAEKYGSPKPKVISDPALIAEMDVLYADVWVSMGDESVKGLSDSQIKALFEPFQLNALNLKNKNIPILHCLPAHKGEEITRELFDLNAELIFDQAENRLHAQKAILVKLLR